MDWRGIETVLLDLDGTLLDRSFDDDFYFNVLPTHYADAHGMAVEQARERLIGLYRAVEGELNWTDLDYWSRTLGLDVPALKFSVRHGIAPHADALVFLEYLRQRRMPTYLVTNAHPKSLAIKMDKTGLDKYLDRIVTAFDVGCLKSRTEYWKNAQAILGFDPSTSLYVDDDEAALSSADKHGMRHLYLRSKPSSSLAAVGSSVYRSIETFHPLMER
jgi:putative hydrolase of the HAD superfamily